MDFELDGWIRFEAFVDGIEDVMTKLRHDAWYNVQIETMWTI